MELAINLDQPLVTLQRPPDPQRKSESPAPFPLGIREKERESTALFPLIRG